MLQTPILKLAIVQTKLHWENPEANRKHFSNVLDGLSEAVDLIILPEMFSTGFSMNPQELAESPDGPTFKWMLDQALKFSSALSGSIIIKEGGDYFNRLFFVKPDGTFSYYNKRHLFSLAGEEKVYKAGDSKLVLDYKGWRINPQICYDLRFPVWCRNTEAFDLQFFVANWPERRAEAWSTLLKARAIENQSYVVGLNRIGEDGQGVYHSGDSAVHDALGTKISKTPPHEEALEIIQLEKSHLNKVRERFSFLNDRDDFSLKL